MAIKTFKFVLVTLGNSYILVSNCGFFQEQKKQEKQKVKYTK